MIAVLGAGNWGTALASVLAKASPVDRVLLWGRTSYNKYLPDINLPENIVFNTDLTTVLNQAHDLLIAIPSNAFTDLINHILIYLKNNNKNNNYFRIAWATKGLDIKTGNFFSDIVAELLGKDTAITILSGPSFAKEVLKELPTSVVLASRNIEIDHNFTAELTKKLQTNFFKIYSCNDIIGVQLGGVLKNILAVASGISDGLGFGSNTKAALITKGLAEGANLITALGGQASTLMGLSGIGDIFLSCSDNQSRNRKFGLLLSTGITIEQAQLQINQAIEALDNIEHVYNLAKNLKINMPVINSIYQAIKNNAKLKEIEFI